MSVHKGSQETYNFIAQWVAPGIYHSIADRWGRMGFLGMFGDFVLSAAQGSILEIGAGESSIYLTGLSQKYNRKIYHIDIEHSKLINPMTVDGYLSYDREYVTNTFVGQPKMRCVCFAGSSDDFFRMIKVEPIALAFIDGDHRYEQVKKDFENVVARLADRGFILMHDTWPPNHEEYIDENHCGTVYKLREELEKDSRFDVLTLTHGTAMGVGLTIVRLR
jgi:hypothetical protein